MLGVGPDGRKYLLERPTHEEVERSLWQMVFEARHRVDDLKKQLRDENEQLISSLCQLKIQPVLVI